MSQYKDAAIGNTVYMWFAANTSAGTAGDGATPLYDVRLAGAAAGAAPTASGTPTLLTHADYTDGLYEIAIDTSGWSQGEYAVFCTLTISSVNPAGFCGSFKLRAASSSSYELIAGMPTSVWATAMSDMAAGAPSATASALVALNWLYEAWRNKVETTATSMKVYKDNGTDAVVQTTIGDDGTTFTKDEFISG